MAVTLLKITRNNVDFLVMHKTRLIFDDSNPQEHIYLLTINLVNEKLEPQDKGIRYDITDKTEETYHRELRQLSSERNQFITSHSTNPEWNPENYINNLNSEESV
jgi:hypothetical protein